MKKHYDILNLGAGVQSSVLFLMPDLKFDAAIFADTQEEPEAVYRHLNWMKDKRPDVPLMICTAGKLGDEVDDTTKQFKTIPAWYETSAGKTSMARRQCTRDYKIDVIEKTIRREILGLKHGQHIPKGIQIHQYIGISTDEISRSLNIRLRMAETHWAIPRFPLLDRGMSRADCLQWLKDYGVPHDVVRSACVFCPFKSNVEWQQLKSTDPTGWARAVEVDKKLNECNMFLHRLFRPLANIDFQYLIDTKHMKGRKESDWNLECEGMCGH